MFGVWQYVPTIFIICWIVAVICTIAVATSKGYSGFLAFLLGLFIPLFGALIVILLLPNKMEMESANRLIRVAAGNTNTVRKRCKKCEKELVGAYTACPHCGSTELMALEEQISSTSDWVCRKCGITNGAGSIFCISCGKQK
jgi:ribosomal protein S27AE